MKGFKYATDKILLNEGFIRKQGIFWILSKKITKMRQNIVRKKALKSNEIITLFSMQIRKIISLRVNRDGVGVIDCYSVQIL
jgi:hypothetical protein